MNIEQSAPQLPQSADEFSAWQQVEPYVQALLATDLSADNLDTWLGQWTALAKLVLETASRRRLAAVLDTENKTVEQQLHTFLEEIDAAWRAADQQLKLHWLASGLQSPGLEVPLRKLRAEVALFCKANLPLIEQEQKLGQEYYKIISAQTVLWDDNELTIDQLQPVLQHPDRQLRERAWRLASARQLADRTVLNAVWSKLLTLRHQLAANAGYADYRTFRWHQLYRFDYTPTDCLAFHAAIEKVVVPAAARVYARRQRHLGLDTLRPWDLEVDPQGRPPLRPFTDATELAAKLTALLVRVDPHLAAEFAFMRRMGLLDLDSRKGKGPAGYCTDFTLQRHPFIVMNAVGLAEDVEILLHEAGHAFHVFATAPLPYHHQWLPEMIGAEFCEVAAMSMELLAAPYLPLEEGGFYTRQDAARAHIEHLERILLFWPYMAVVDAFQHWVYTHPAAAAEPTRCDAHWGTLWQRYMRDVDWDGLEQEMVTGWQRRFHLFQVPFYYVEYGLAQLGAVQIWQQAQENQAEALTRYRQALALGCTVPLPQLYAAAGARFAFDATTLENAVVFIEQTIAELETG